MVELAVRAVHRRRGEATNLFVRLSPSALSILLASQPQPQNERENDWTGTARHRVEEIEFLPLEIKVADGTTLYASYNGGLMDSVDDPVLELPEGLGRAAGRLVEVRIVLASSVADAAIVTVDPVSTTDWELLEQHAAWLERGGILQQVSLVYPSQVLPLHIPAASRTVAVVVQDDDDDQNNDKAAWSELSWPDEKELSSNLPRATLCRRLVASTQFVVIPKPRKAPTTTTNDVVLTVAPSWNDGGVPLQNLATLLSRVETLPPTRPGTALVHPATWRRLVGDRENKSRGPIVVRISAVREQQQQQKRPSTSSLPPTAVFASLVESNQVGVDSVVLDAFLRRSLRIARYGRKIRVVLLSPFEVEQKLREFSDVLGNTTSCTLTIREVHCNTGRDSGLPLLCAMGSLVVPVSTLDGRAPPVLSDGSPSWGLEDDTLCTVGALLPCVEGHSFYRLWLDKGGTTNSTLSNELIVPGSRLWTLLQRVPPGIKKKNSETETIKITDIADVVEFLPLTTVVPSTLAESVPCCMSECNVVLHGKEGCGKTHTALLYAARAHLLFQCKTVFMECKRLKDAFGLTLEGLLNIMTKKVHEGIRNRPSILVFDDLDELVKDYEGYSDNLGSSNMEQVSQAEIDEAQVVQHHFMSLLQFCSSYRNEIAFVITCTSKQASFSRYAEKLVELPILSPNEHCSVFLRMLESKVPSLGRLDDDCVSSQMLGNLLPKDFEVLCSRVSKAVSACGAPEASEVIERCLSSYVPLNRKGTVDGTMNDAIPWENVGGLTKAKSEIEKSILRPMRYKRIYDVSKISLPKGFLLLGPPGCGKTVLAKALAKRANLPLIVCRGPEVLDKYIGASEAKIRDLFEQAATAAPSILFFDELDALAPHRGSDHTGVTDRVVNQLLTFLDGVEDLDTKKTVLVIGGSARPDRIDSALLRPGRLEKHIYVGPHEDVAELMDTFVKVSKDFTVGQDLADSLGRLVYDFYRSQGSQITPADVKALFGTAHVAAVQEFVNQGSSLAKPTIKELHLQKAIQGFRPSLSQAEWRRLDKIYERYRVNSQPSFDPKRVDPTMDDMKTALR